MPRLNALLTAGLLLFANARGVFGVVACPMHDGAAGASHAAAPAHQAAAGHHMAQPEDAGSGKQQHHGPCTCLDHCRACRAVAMASRAPVLAETAILLHSVSAATAVAGYVPSRAPHQLPFSTAPPAIA